MNNNLTWRYATKKFDNTRRVSVENIQEIKDAMRYAPTSFGLQPFFVIEIKDITLREKLRNVSFGQPQITDCDTLFVFVARSDISLRIEEYMTQMSNGDPSVRASLKDYEGMMTGTLSGLTEEQSFAWAARQAYLALGFALYTASTLEVDACPMEGFDREKIGEVLGLKANEKALAYMTVGYRSSDDSHALRPKVRMTEEKFFRKI